MKRVLFVLAMVGLAAGAERLQAQAESPKSSLFVSPYAGYMVFGDRLKGPLGTSLSNKNSPVFGAQAGIGLTKNVSLVGNVGYAKTNWTVGAPIIGNLSVADANVWIYNAGLEYRLPLTGMESTVLTPVFQLGAGAVRYSVGGLPVGNLPVIGSLPLSLSSTNFAANAGVGVDYRVTPSLGLRLMAKDYVGKFDMREATALDFGAKTSQHWALSAGLKIGF